MRANTRYTQYNDRTLSLYKPCLAVFTGFAFDVRNSVGKYNVDDFHTNKQQLWFKNNNEDHQPKTLVHGIPHGIVKRGRPRLIWWMELGASRRWG